MNTYQQIIREMLAKDGQIGQFDPRHVEAWMRLEHGTLDALSKGQFVAEVRTATQCIQAGPLADSESLARSEAL